MQFISTDKTMSAHQSRRGACAEDVQPSSNIRGGTFMMNCYGRLFFGNGNNKVIMPKNKNLQLTSKKIMI